MTLSGGRNSADVRNRWHRADHGPAVHTTPGWVDFQAGTWLAAAGFDGRSRRPRCRGSCAWSSVIRLVARVGRRFG